MTLDELRGLMLFETFSDEQLQWLNEHSSVIALAEGERLLNEGELAVAFYVLTGGEWRLSRTVEGIETIITTTGYVGSWLGGIPLIDGNYQTTASATKPSHFLKIPNESLAFMLNHGFPIAHHLLAGISAGARNTEAIMRQHEKMAALGKLSAGLAHELNNPAAAGRRAAGQLRECLAVIQSEALKLNRLLQPAQLAQLNELQQGATERAKNPPSLDSLAQSEREDELSSWLDDHTVADGWKLASTLVETGLDTVWLDGLLDTTGADALNPVLNWLVASLTATQLLNQLDNSTERISSLVKAIKEYSYMDQAPQQEVDLRQGLESSLTMLAHKLKQGVEVTREYDPDLPRLTVYGSELNQVWTNLLDNAVDAMNGRGHIWVRTRREGDRAVVEIADNGPGIPAEIQSRVFEPFFTTKGVGQGTGLGLEIVYRVVVRQHKGDIKLESVPGDTRFRVYLPLNS